MTRWFRWSSEGWEKSDSLEGQAEVTPIQEAVLSEGGVILSYVS